MIPKFCYLEKIGLLARGNNEELRAAELARLRPESGLPPYDWRGILKKMRRFRRWVISRRLLHRHDVRCLHLRAKYSALGEVSDRTFGPI
jgi:hypothetical protein